MVKERETFTYGDRTNFSFYDFKKDYRSHNPYIYPLISGFVERAIRKYGFAVYIESVESARGKDLSRLAFHFGKPDYVFGPSFKLGDSPGDKERRGVVAKFIRQAEAAHEATKNSKLVFKKFVG